MKTFLVSITLLLATSLSAQDKYDIFMTKMDVQNEAKAFVNNYIDKLASQSNGINLSQWEAIKTEIDYSPYFIGIKAVLMNNYTIAEIDEIFAANDMLTSINDTGKLIYKPKPEVREQMYKISRTFGKIVNSQIKKLIEEL